MSFEILQRVVQFDARCGGRSGSFHCGRGYQGRAERRRRQLFINTSGIGIVDADIDISGTNANVGDVLIVSGTLGDHGIAVMSAREGLGFTTDLQSDVAPLNHLVRAMLEAGEVHVLRDPTRGGLATTLNEIAKQSNVVIELQDQKIPVKPQVRAACEMLGFDPLYVANEGKLIAFVKAEDVEKILAVMQQTRYGKDAVVIGRVIDAGKIPGPVEDRHRRHAPGGHAARRDAAAHLLGSGCTGCRGASIFRFFF